MRRNHSETTKTRRNLRQINCPPQQPLWSKPQFITQRSCQNVSSLRLAQTKGGRADRSVVGSTEQRGAGTTRLTTMGLFTIDQQGPSGVVCLFGGGSGAGPTGDRYKVKLGRKGWCHAGLFYLSDIVVIIVRLINLVSCLSYNAVRCFT